MCVVNQYCIVPAGSGYYLHSAFNSPCGSKCFCSIFERNAKRKNSPSKKSVENEPIKAQIKSILTDTPHTASEIAETVGISTQKASALLRQIDGLTVTEVKVKGKGKVKGYALA